VVQKPAAVAALPAARLTLKPTAKWLRDPRARRATLVQNTKIMPSSPYAALLAATLWSCMATPTAAGKRVHDSTEPGIAACQFVSEFSEKAQNLGSVEEAKNRARNSAAKLGATDIVWKDIVYRGRNTDVVGKAYRCQPRSY